MVVDCIMTTVKSKYVVSMPSPEQECRAQWAMTYPNDFSPGSLDRISESISTPS
jgi:hypothetical protein